MIIKFPTERAKAQLTASEIEMNETFALADSIVWPELPEPRDFPENDEDLADIEFDGIPEFRSDGYGAGTPEFQKQLEAYFRTVLFASRAAFAVLGFSRRELVKKSGVPCGTDDHIGVEVARILVAGRRDLVRLLRYVRAAEVRQMCAVAECDVLAGDTDEID